MTAVGTTRETPVGTVMADESACTPGITDAFSKCRCDLREYGPRISAVPIPCTRGVTARHVPVSGFLRHLDAPGASSGNVHPVGHLVKSFDDVVALGRVSQLLGTEA
ncbi:hypothetical protein GCM10010341_43740 [Streptomyces noursei]|nr:hypothetical protein GCM10010341_43740 [Streptomyces noursei]